MQSNNIVNSTEYDELELKNYHLLIIREIAAELSGVRHPRQILESFLMSAQGGVGAKGGFIFFSGDDYQVYRGVEKIENDCIKIISKEALDHITNKAESFPFFIDLGLLKNRSVFSNISSNISSDISSNISSQYISKNIINSDLAILLCCPIENKIAILGLTNAMHGREYDSKDQQLLTSIASLFQIGLNFALFSTQVELLNSQLQKQNIELDRQVFHLNALRELSIEAGHSHNVDSVLASFLPTLLGRFSRHQAIAVVYDRASGKIHFKSMGIEPELSIKDSHQVERLLFLCLAGVQNKHIQPLQVEPVIQIETLSTIVKGFVPETGFFFMIKEQMYGALLLGRPLEDRKLSEQEQELLFASVAQSVLHINNADSFATIVDLNKNLEQQNEELRKTIDELTNAKNRINSLEDAAIRIAKMVNRNAERLKQVRPLDFTLIIGISLVLSLIFNLQSPRGIPIMPIPRPDLIKSISVSEANNLIAKENPLIIDARPREFYEIGHVKGAVNVSPSLFDMIYSMQFDDEDPERPLIVYGRSFSRLYDQDVAIKFMNHDHERIYIVDDSLEQIYKLQIKNGENSSGIELKKL